jgi:hypothetical protein
MLSMYMPTETATKSPLTPTIPMPYVQTGGVNFRLEEEKEEDSRLLFVKAIYSF